MTHLVPNPVRAAVDAATARDQPPAVALMLILTEAPDETTARSALAAARAACVPGSPADRRLAAVAGLWAAHPGAWAAVRGTVTGIAHRRPDETPTGTLRYWAATFDRLVAAAPEASVALYSLGSPELLAAATAEAVARMDGWGLLGPDRDALDLGCGIGRFAGALAPHLRSVLGLDVSAGMVAEARRRHPHVANLRFAQTAGDTRDGLADGSFDLVLAADVFPYLVEAGGGLAAAHVAAFARLLRPGGHVLVFNWSYRGDLDADRRDIAALAAAHGFTVLLHGTRDLRTWDGAAFLLRAGGEAATGMIPAPAGP